jgi:hypothetical protein
VRAVEVDADLRVCAIPAEGPLSGFPHCRQRAGAAGRRRWDIHVRRAKGLLDFLSTPTKHEVYALQLRDAQALRDFCTRREAEYDVDDDWDA